MPDALALLPIRLLLTVPVAACSCLLLVVVCGVLRLREPWLRVGLTGLALLDVVAVALGVPTGGFVFARITVEPALATEALRPLSGPALAVWAGLVALCLLVERLRRRRLAARVAALATWFPPPPDVAAAVERAAARTGRAAPRIAFVPGGGSPFLCLDGAAVLVLPRATWSATRSAAARRALLAHELEHARPLDVALRRGASWLRLAFVFNPFVALLVRRLLRESEALTDRAALRRGASARGLAEALVAAGSGPPAVPAVGLSSSFRAAHARLRLLRAAPRRAVVAAQLLALVLLLPWDVGRDRMHFDPTRTASGGAPETGRVEVHLAWAASPLARPVLGALLPPRPLSPSDD